jgi:hypothetical protein
MSNKALWLGWSVVAALVVFGIWKFARGPETLDELDEAMAKSGPHERQKLASRYVKRMQSPAWWRWYLAVYTHGERKRKNRAA